jgi:hypothetical protein
MSVKRVLETRTRMPWLVIELRKGLVGDNS